MVYDLIIVGGGPAGCAAGVYAGRKQLKTLLITEEFGGQSMVSPEIQNWIGTIAISGLDLAKQLKNHVEHYAGDFLNIKKDLVLKIEKNGNNFLIKTKKGDEIESKTILITTGSKRRKLEALGADRLEHKGLTYCASCDGPMFADKKVAVIGGGNAAFETVAQLLAYAKEVFLFNRGEKYRADEITIEKVLANPKVTSVTNADILEIKGENFVDGIVFLDKNSGEKKEMNVEGIFVEIGQIPNNDLIKDLVELDEFGKVKIDYKNQQTSISGVWAAGDCTNYLYHQNNIAVGDGIRALEDIYQYLHTK